MRSFIITENDAGQRLDKFLSKAVKKLPPSLLYKYIRTKRIKVGGKRCAISTRLCEGDRVDLYINDEFFEEKSGAYPFLSAPAALDILYEDENILLLDKKPGLLVHEDDREKRWWPACCTISIKRANTTPRTKIHLCRLCATALTGTPAAS